ncbi:uncharacterized [Tachysurus ichikawai]
MNSQKLPTRPCAPVAQKPVTMEINAAQLEEKKFQILLERQESYLSCEESGAALGGRVLLRHGLQRVCGV